MEKYVSSGNPNYFMSLRDAVGEVVELTYAELKALQVLSELDKDTVDSVVSIIRKVGVQYGCMD
jgi:hypothetical protein